MGVEGCKTHLDCKMGGFLRVDGRHFRLYDPIVDYTTMGVNEQDRNLVVFFCLSMNILMEPVNFCLFEI